MRQKGPLKQFDEFDAWSFSRLGDSIRSEDVNFDFPRLASDENILASHVESWEVSGRINAKSESVIRFKGRFTAELSCVVCDSGVQPAMQSAGLPRARDFTSPNVQAIGVLAM